MAQAPHDNGVSGAAVIVNADSDYQSVDSYKLYGALLVETSIDQFPTSCRSSNKHLVSSTSIENESILVRQPPSKSPSQSPPDLTLRAS